jgi:hypothetical protein
MLLTVACCAGFGAAAAPFGGAVTSGTRAVQFQKTQDTDAAAGATGSKTLVYFNHICAMKAYENKSAEELRWEDYQARLPKGALRINGSH